MRKSVYSLVLMDEVVEAVDRLAYTMNTSRSNLINQILAERVSYVTPEMRMRDIFHTLEQMMAEECFQIQEQASDAMMSIRSPLRYKYKPTIRYSIELYRIPEDIAGQLKVSFRTQSQALLQTFGQFFDLWVQMENGYLAAVYPSGVPCTVEDGKYIRGFIKWNVKAPGTEEEMGNAIAAYIKLLDSAIKGFFELSETPQEAFFRIRQDYEAYLKDGVLVI